MKTRDRLIRTSILVLVLTLGSAICFAQEDTRTPDPASDGRLTKPEPKEGNPMPEFPEMLGPVVMDRGRVALMVSLDTKGNISSYRIVGEQPKGFGFREAVEAVIDDWKYLPALWGKNPVDYNTSLVIMFESGQSYIDNRRDRNPTDVKVKTE